MLPIQIAGLALAGTVAAKKASGEAFFSKNRVRPHPVPRPLPIPEPVKNQLAAIPETIQNIVTGLSTSLTQLVQGPPREDYKAVVKDFLPANAELLTPPYPENVGQFRFADLDGDSRDELITTYKNGKNLTALILKKQDEQWKKVTEITESKYEAVNHLSFTDITGEGRKHILLGWKTKEGPGELHGYSLQDGKATRLFAHSYNRLEVLEPQAAQGVLKTRLALWNKTEMGGFTVEVKHWNGSQLEPVKSPVPYFHRNVIPYYGSKVRQSPQTPSHWYYLADALSKAEMYRDAITAANYGISLNPPSPLKEAFMALKTSVREQIKG